jgi:hypothetical protein
VIREERPNDGTEDFDERCDGTESCDCDDCLADDEDYCRLCGAFLDGDFGRREPDTDICTECAEDFDDGPYVPDEFPDDGDDAEHDFTEEDVVT